MKVFNLFFYFLLAFDLFGQQSKALILSTNAPETGKALEVTYSGPLANSTGKMFAVIYKSSFIDTDIKRIPSYFQNDKLHGKLTLPDSTIFFVIKVVDGSAIDNNDGVGYKFNVYLNGEVIPKSLFAEGYFDYQNKLLFGGKSNSTRSIQLMEEELSVRPNLKNELYPYYLRALFQIPDKKLQAMTLAKQMFDCIIEGDIAETSSVIYSYIISGNNRRAMDSLVTITANLYPHGTSDFNKKLKLLQNTSGNQPNLSIQQYERIKEEFKKLTIIQARLLFTEMLWIYAMKNDLQAVDQNTTWLLSREESHETYSYIAAKFREVAYTFAKQDSTLSTAKKYAEKALWASKQSDTLSINYAKGLDLYARLLFLEGEKELALNTQRKAVELRSNDDESINEHFITYLFANEKYKETIETALLYDRLKVSTTKVDSIYTKAIQFSNYNENTKKLKSKTYNKDEAFKQSIRDRLINIPAPYFSLKNLEGKEIKLSDYRGEILVIDFWATWCTPCIKSFPAMKEIKDELENDSVKFLFIDTFEDQISVDKGSKATIERIKNLLNKKGLNDFNVGIDILVNNLNLTAMNYNVTSIPEKIVIDKSGNIRYRSTGFSSDDKLKRELKMVIELITK